MTTIRGFRRPERRAAAAALAVLLIATGALAAFDPSGLLAPVGGQGVPLIGVASVYQWAPLLVGLPVLLFATAAPILLVTRSRRYSWAVFAITLAAVVAAEALNVTITGFISAVPL